MIRYLTILIFTIILIAGIIINIKTRKIHVEKKLTENIKNEVPIKKEEPTNFETNPLNYTIEQILQQITDKKIKELENDYDNYIRCSALAKQEYNICNAAINKDICLRDYYNTFLDAFLLDKEFDFEKKECTKLIANIQNVKPLNEDFDLIYILKEAIKIKKSDEICTILKEGIDELRKSSKHNICDKLELKGEILNKCYTRIPRTINDIPVKNTEARKIYKNILTNEKYDCSWFEETKEKCTIFMNRSLNICEERLVKVWKEYYNSILENRSKDIEEIRKKESEENFKKGREEFIKKEIQKQKELEEKIKKEALKEIEERRKIESEENLRKGKEEFIKKLKEEEEKRKAEEEAKKQKEKERKIQEELKKLEEEANKRAKEILKGLKKGGEDEENEEIE